MLRQVGITAAGVAFGYGVSKAWAETITYPNAHGMGCEALYTQAEAQEFANENPEKARYARDIHQAGLENREMQEESEEEDEGLLDKVNVLS